MAEQEEDCFQKKTCREFFMDSMLAIGGPLWVKCLA